MLHLFPAGSMDTGSLLQLPALIQIHSHLFYPGRLCQRLRIQRSVKSNQVRASLLPGIPGRSISRIQPYTLDMIDIDIPDLCQFTGNRF